MIPTTLVLGASEKEHRYSNMAIKDLLDKGMVVLALGRRQGRTHDVEISTEWPSDVPIDTITLYLNRENQAPYIDRILNSGAKRVIFNPGAENPILESQLQEKAIYFERACTLVLLATNQY